MNLSCLQEAGDRLKLRVRKNQEVSSHLNSSNSKKLSRRYDPGKPFLSLAAVGDLPCNRFTSNHFSNLPWASDSEKWSEHSLAAGTLQFIGHNRGVPYSVSCRTKRPRMLTTKNSFPGSLSIMLIASWNKSSGMNDKGKVPRPIFIYKKSRSPANIGRIESEKNKLSIPVRMVAVF